jgi:hypothetical protein
LADLHRYGGLGEVQFFGSTRKAQSSGDALENLKLSQGDIHGFFARFISSGLSFK